MKKLTVLVMILALPAMAYGAAGYSVLSGGQPAASIDVNALPASLALDIVLTNTEAGAFGFGGSLAGPAGLTVSARQFQTSPTNVAGWGFRNNEDPAIVGAGLPTVDFGAIDISGSSTLNAGAQTVVTLTISGINTLGEGVYNFQVIDDPNLPGGSNTGWWSNTGSPIAADTSLPFVLTVTPEPATMLLLAAALPFLRRRSA